MCIHPSRNPELGYRSSKFMIICSVMVEQNAFESTTQLNTLIE